VEFRSSDNFCQFLHIRGFDVDNVEALVLDIQIPQVDPEIVTTDKGLAVAVYGDTVDVIGMGVGVGASGHGGDDGVMVGHAWEFQGGRILEWQAGWSRGTAATDGAGRSEVMGEIIFSNYLKRLIKHLP
jgi:hypothetical protein